jgi:four helix bundle protein
MKNNKNREEFKTRLYSFVLKMVRYIDNLENKNVNNVIGKQLLRSGTSVIANYIEANSACSKKDYINYFNYSLKSANESKLWLCLLRDVNQKSNINEELLKELIEISNIFASSILTLKNKKNI